MRASRSIRFFIVALAGGAVAQDLLGVAGAATDQINPQPVDVTNINAPVDTGAATNPAPWVPGTEDATTPVPNPEAANIIDTLPQPAPETEAAPAADAVAVPIPVDLPPDTNTSLPDSAPTPSSTPPFEPFTSLSSDLTTTTPTPTQIQTPPPGIILRPTNLPSLDSDPSSNSTLTTTAPAIGITMAPPRPTTLQTVITSAHTEIPLWTPGGFAGSGNAENTEGGEGKEGEGPGGEEEGKEAKEQEGPKQDFKPAHSWVLPLNWAFPGGKKEGQAGL